MPLATYVDRVSRCMVRFDGLRFVYMPHRRESQKTIDAVASLPHVVIEHPSLPVEAEFIKRRVRPLHIAAFLSTALYTLKKIFSDSNVTAFRLPLADVAPSREGLITPIYKYLSAFVDVVGL